MLFSLPFPEMDTPLRLLVVDDQQFDRDIICARLREAVPYNAVIHEAANGATAYAMILDQSIPINCVLLDLNLGDIHGAELTKKILAIRPELTVIIITVEKDMARALECLKAGAEDFIIKGEYSNISIYRAIRYSMERRRVSLENYRLSKALARERALTDAQREFIHFVSHEFRTPMTIISGAAQLLAAKAPELVQGEGAKQFTKINGAIARLGLMLDDVIRLSRLEDGKDSFQLTAFDLVALIKNLITEADDSRIRCSATFRRLSFKGDVRYVQYALHNLISNALKYSPSDQSVEVRLAKGIDTVTIEVEDHGAGMAPEALARIGEKFYRDPSTSHIEGTGLGLYLTKRFMEHHGGRLEFESKSGRGTIARLVFPAVE